MKKILLSLLALTSLTFARENPFFPSEGTKDLPISSNTPVGRPQLGRTAITLPDSARILKNVTIKYQNLDGSLESKSITLDHNVDWHIPIFISQSYNSNKKPKTLKKKKSALKPTQSITDFVGYSINGNTIELISDDKVIRDFMLINPHRVAIDFKRDTSFKSKNIPLTSKPFKMIKYGNHGSYYRVVIVLDGKYRYKLTKHSGKVVISLN